MKKLLVIIIILWLVTLPALLPQNKAHAQQPTPQPVVRMVLFWMEGCPHCEQVLKETIRPLQEKYGEQLAITFIEVVTSEDVNRLYKIGEQKGIPKGEIGVPMIVIGGRILVGSEQIPRELPGLVETYLAKGGVDAPADFNLEAMPTSIPASVLENPGSAVNVVHAVLFESPDCHACQLIIAKGVTPLLEKYGDQLILRTVKVITSEDVNQLYQIAANYGLTDDEVDLPMLIIDHQVLIADEIIPQFSTLVEQYLAAGGIEPPDINLEEPNQPASLNSTVDGFGLGIAAMILLAIALIYALAAFISRKTILSGLSQTWQDALFWLLTLIGLGIAAYLTYVETKQIAAFCGPVGNCNRVQTSPYAMLFNIAPVGALGILAYIVMGVSMLISKQDWGKISNLITPRIVFGVAFCSVIFSLYLTYLELFRIQAICSWCIMSAIVTAGLFIISIELVLHIPQQVNHRVK